MALTEKPLCRWPEPLLPCKEAKATAALYPQLTNARLTRTRPGAQALAMQGRRQLRCRRFVTPRSTPACLCVRAQHPPARVPRLCPPRRRGSGRARAAPLLPAPEKPASASRGPSSGPRPAWPQTLLQPALAHREPRHGQAAWPWLPRGSAEPVARRGAVRGRQAAPPRSPYDLHPRASDTLKKQALLPPSPPRLLFHTPPVSLRPPSAPRCRQLPPGGVSHSREAPVILRPRPRPRPRPHQAHGPAPTVLGPTYMKAPPPGTHPPRLPRPLSPQLLSLPVSLVSSPSYQAPAHPPVRPIL